MKTILSILIAAIFAIKLSAADTNAPAPLKIGTLEATNYYDKEMIVTGKVAQVTIRPSVTFLNLDQPHPDSPFTVVIFHGHSSFYGDANKLKGKSIEIKGKIKNYHDKPEIALDSTNQLTVVGVTNLSLFLNPPVATTNAPAIPSPTKAPPVAPSANGIPEIL
jgi:DNA/RNA endonuclease YhcR with UshA esterase domain